jgi:NADPH:quinone reductase-like Zn-dependent oxidoreductase
MTTLSVRDDEQGDRGLRIDAQPSSAWQVQRFVAAGPHPPISTTTTATTSRAFDPRRVMVDHQRAWLNVYGVRAVVFTAFGDPSVLHVQDVPLPKVGSGQVLIRVEAAAVNPADLAARSGAFGAMLPPGRYVPGWDVAGIVVETAPDVRGFELGEAVVGTSDWLRTHVGTHAEHVVLDAGALAPAPTSVPSVEAATLPVNALTAVQALDLLSLSPGDTLAVTGAGGAVGGYAVELARLRGLQVLGIGSEQDRTFLTKLGATFVLRSEDPAGAVRDIIADGVDGVLDTAALGPAALAAVRDGGAFLSVLRPATPTAQRGIRVDTVSVHSDGNALRDLVALVDDDRLTLRVADTFTLEESAQAHALLARHGVRGRPVLLAQ